MSRRKILEYEQAYQRHLEELQQNAVTPFEQVPMHGASSHPKPGVYLNNPSAQAPIDRGAVQSPVVRPRSW